LIVHNERRHGKTLRGVRGQGRPLEWLVGEDERDELERVVTHLKITRMRTGAALGDFAILYRSNHQSRGVEELLREEGLPYLLVGGTRFYDRREVKDAIAYLRLVNNPNDEVSLFRVINFPARGIGRTSQTALHTHARAEKRPCIEIMREAELRDEFAPAAATSMQRLAELLDRFRTRFTQEPLGTVLRELLAEIGFHRAVEKEKSDAKGKETAVGLVHEFELATDHFARQNPEGSLKDYLERLALFSMPDENEDYDQGRQVRLMTVHGAKGLEFPMVYVTGMAEDVFPHKRSLDEGGEDEERRLAYVAITRAQQQLVFSMAKARKRYGETIRQQPSRFVLEVEPTLFDGVPPHADGQVPRAPLPEKKAQARGRFFEQIRRMGGDGA
jgi:superfamily I DNA/RNA helicase